MKTSKVKFYISAERENAQYLLEIEQYNGKMCLKKPLNTADYNLYKSLGIIDELLKMGGVS